MMDHIGCLRFQLEPPLDYSAGSLGEFPMGLTVLSTSVYLAHRAQLCCLQCCDLVRVAGHCVCGVLQPTSWFVLCNLVLSV